MSTTTTHNFTTPDSNAQVLHKVTIHLSGGKQRVTFGTKPLFHLDGTLSLIDTVTGERIYFCGSFTLEAQHAAA